MHASAFRRITGLFLPGLLLIEAGASAGAQTGTTNTAKVEASLDIEKRMQAHRITALSLAIVEADEVKWLRAYGLRRAGDPNSKVTTTTLFDAASISKPVAAVAALRLVEQGRVSLTDTDMLTEVARKHLQPVEWAQFLGLFERPGEIDLARVLMHCAGVLFQRQVGTTATMQNRTGAQAFSLSSTLPTMRQQLLGISPASTGYRPVQTPGLRPGVRFQYSGAPYLLVQAVINRYAPNGFADYTTRLFRDLGMTRTTFANAAAIRTSTRFGTTALALGHSGGTTQAVMNYPNQAAADLVTTAEDLARFLIMVNRSGIAASGRILSTRSVNDLIGFRSSVADSRCGNRVIGTQNGSMGLGLRRNNAGTVHHRGTHGGYRTYIQARPAAGRWAMAVLMTGAAGDATRFAAELFRVVETVYGFPANSLVEGS